MEIRGACCFHIGYTKEKNEDNFLFDKKTLQDIGTQSGVLTAEICGEACFAVFDGMGGLSDGEIASAMVAELLQKAQPRKNEEESRTMWIGRILQQVHRSIVARSEEQGCQMGATAALVAVDEEYCTIANVGDSRVYCLKAHKLKQLSEDHSDRNLLRELSIIGRAPSLLQYMGNRSVHAGMEPTVLEMKRQGNARYLICSDGLTDMVPDQRIEEICNGTEAPEECAELLVECALEHGGKDNITVIVFDLCDKVPTIWNRIGEKVKEIVEGTRSERASEP